MIKRTLLVVVIAASLVGCGPATESPPRATAVPEATSEPTAAPPTATPESTATPEPTIGPLPGDTQTRSVDGMTMVYVPAGEYPIGSTEAESDAAFAQCEEDRGAGACYRTWFEGESPRHTVSLDAFWIDRTEVTNAQYEACVEAGVCEASYYADDSRFNGSQQPVVGVDWYNARDYCEWAGGRLPREAEWEAAARGPEGWIYPWGNSFDGSRVNYCDASCPRDWRDTDYDDGYEGTAPVGSFPSGASWCGALDMAGNVWEWVGDWYDLDYYADSPAENPAGPASGEYRVLRGGSWGLDPGYVRSAVRYRSVPANSYFYFGFRCLLSAR